MNEEERLAHYNLMDPAVKDMQVTGEGVFRELCDLYGLPQYIGTRTHTLGWYDRDGALKGWFWEDADFGVDRRVLVVRADPLVGSGTCSTVAEAMDDSDIVDYLDGVGAETEADAIREMREYEEMHLESGLNQRWGESNDPQLLEYHAWRVRRARLEGKSLEDLVGTRAEWVDSVLRETAGKPEPSQFSVMIKVARHLEQRLTAAIMVLETVRVGDPGEVTLEELVYIKTPPPRPEPTPVVDKDGYHTPQEREGVDEEG